MPSASRRSSFSLTIASPYDAGGLFAFLGERAVEGVESWDGSRYCRTLRLGHGHGVVRVDAPAPDHPTVLFGELGVADERDLDAAAERARRLFGLDPAAGAAAAAADAVLGEDPLLGPLVARRRGLRLPGSVDAFEVVVRAIIGQQISVAGARTVAGRLAARWGSAVVLGLDRTASPPRLFPTPAQLAAADPDELPMPRARARALVGLSAAMASGRVLLDPTAGHDELRSVLLAQPGVGPWTADYVLLRAFGAPDVFLAGDLGVRRALEALGAPGDPRAAAALAERWRPWRSYATLHLWHSLSSPPPRPARAAGAGDARATG